MVDTKDLKSFGHCDRAGSSPASSTTIQSPPASLTRGVAGIFSINTNRKLQVHNFKYNFLILVLTAFVCAMPVSLTAAESSSSLLSQGRWIKVHVDTTSVFRLSHDTLREWGFTNPDKVIVAGYGSVERAHTLDTAPDDLPILPVYHDKDAIYFYGEGDTRVTLTSVPGAS